MKITNNILYGDLAKGPDFNEFLQVFFDKEIESNRDDNMEEKKIIKGTDKFPKKTIRADITFKYENILFNATYLRTLTAWTIATMEELDNPLGLTRGGEEWLQQNIDDEVEYAWNLLPINAEPVLIAVTYTKPSVEDQYDKLVQYYMFHPTSTADVLHDIYVMWEETGLDDSEFVKLIAKIDAIPFNLLHNLKRVVLDKYNNMCAEGLKDPFVQELIKDDND